MSASATQGGHNKTHEEEEVCLDERPVAAQSALWSDNHRRRDTTAAYP